MDEILVKLLACILVIAFVFGVPFGMAAGIGYAIERPSCYAHWKNSGMAVQWSFWGDCQLQQSNGSWITDTAYIALNINVHVNGTH